MPRFLALLPISLVLAACGGGGRSGGAGSAGGGTTPDYNGMPTDTSQTTTSPPSY
jgi:hypothetical protein